MIKSYEDIKIEDEGLTQTDYIYKIKEDNETYKLQIIDITFSLEELNKELEDLSKKFESDYNQRRETKNLFEDKLYSLALNYNRLIESNPQDQIKVKQMLAQLSRN